MAFQDKTVLVTGGGSGIGKAFVTYFAQEGANVLIADISASNGETTAKELKDSKGKISSIVTDVTSFPSVAQAFNAARGLSSSKRVDIVLSNAGTLDNAQPTYPAADAPADLDAYYSNPTPPNLSCVDISVTGGLYVSHVALAQFRGQGPDKDGFRGKLVHAGSEAGIVHMPGDVLYGTAKAGVLGLVRALGVRVASEGITVNAYAPNLIETNIAGPGLFAGAKERDQLSKKEDLVERIVKHFLVPTSKLSGQILGANGPEFFLRAIPAYFSPDSQLNAAAFFPSELVTEALKVPEGTVTRPL